MDEREARDLVAGERRRVEAELQRLTSDLAAELAASDPTSDAETSELATELTEQALIADLRARLADVVRAEDRLRSGTYGRSVDSGLPIPDDRLRADPVAERTVEEQRRFEAT
jgi:DnaK suppressor protein